MNRQIKHLALLFAAALSLGSCTKDNTPVSVPVSGDNLGFSAPENVTSMEVVSGAYTFTNVTTGLSSELAYPLSSGSALTAGLYHVKFSGQARCTVDLTRSGESSVEPLTLSVQGARNNVVVPGDGTFRLTLALSVIPGSSDDFVITELYYTGSAYSPDASGKQKQYNGDAYVVITNNSDRVLYADGLAFVESQFNTSSKYDYTPDIRDEALTVDAVLVIPGSGTDHPVAPGASLVLCDNAQNHQEADPSFMNLSGAAFEWYTRSTHSNYPDTDNPSVPNLDIWYCYTATIFVLNKQGTSSYALARMPVSRDEWLGGYTYQASYINALGKPTPTKTYYKIPNAWIVDAVELRGAKYDFQWPVFDPSLDISYTYTGELGSSTVAYGRSVKRKVISGADGRTVLQDTNNSAEDFERNVSPSLR